MAGFLSKASYTISFKNIVSTIGHVMQYMSKCGNPKYHIAYSLHTYKLIKPQITSDYNMSLDEDGDIKADCKTLNFVGEGKYYLVTEKDGQTSEIERIVIKSSEVSKPMKCLPSYYHDKHEEPEVPKSVEMTTQFIKKNEERTYNYTSGIEYFTGNPVSYYCPNIYMSNSMDSDDDNNYIVGHNSNLLHSGAEGGEILNSYTLKFTKAGTFYVFRVYDSKYRLKVIVDKIVVEDVATETNTETK